MLWPRCNGQSVISFFFNLHPPPAYTVRARPSVSLDYCCDLLKDLFQPYQSSCFNSQLRLHVTWGYFEALDNAKQWLAACRHFPDVHQL